MLQGRGDRAVIMSLLRDKHIPALRLTSEMQQLVDAIDGDRSVHQVLHRAGVKQREDLHTALAVLYTLDETRIADLI